MTSRAYTQEEIREEFLAHIRGLCWYWDTQVRETHSVRDRLNGLAHSILATLDGCDGEMPAFTVIPMPHPDDQAFHEAEGSPYYPYDPTLDDHPNDIGGSLHELFYKKDAV